MACFMFCLNFELLLMRFFPSTVLCMALFKTHTQTHTHTIGRGYVEPDELYSDDHVAAVQTGSGTHVSNAHELNIRHFL